MIIPRTSGCGCFGNDKNSSKKNSKNLYYDDNKKDITPIFKNILKEVFKKFDLANNSLMKYDDFKEFWFMMFDKEIAENEFFNNIVNKYSKGEEGITEKGFINLFKDFYLTMGKDVIDKFIENLGYDENFFPLRSRLFNLVFYSEEVINLQTKDSLNCDLNYIVNNLILRKKGIEKEVETKENMEMYSAIENHYL